ncbi:glycoside hydrolase family 15 protein [Nocardia vermiculata]|uniref:Glycoside hydrolase family 15 protein n=1 Tax=Nocardia vermiculata TaxID=257274 RepID=A0A846XWT2_9NOCA|nr:glycoside hydrolase family 15 protein [Nocardia vermiculata]NKY49538.1 glycoside hydrolase family 15 protein [Nocardia vermiculata]
MDPYPPIADHGIVGDLQTAALVSSAGTVDWWCTPRFDSPSVFGALLDHERGGYFRIAADLPEGDVAIKQLYLPDTAALVTRFMAPDGVGEVADFMLPIDNDAPTDRHRLIRVVRVVRGTLPFTVACRPRFDYGRAQHRTETHGERWIVFAGPETTVHLQACAPVVFGVEDGDAVGRFELGQGETAVITLTATAAGSDFPAAPERDRVAAEFGQCREWWQQWLRHSTYRGRWRDMVDRSAITLKLLTYAPTGAPIAAATMGLPEQPGGERNWDYRYTWIRDGSLSVRALLDLGFTAEALAFRRWLRDRLEAGNTASGEPLQIMYRVDGDPRLDEQVLEHWEGYRGSAPVRVGNGAADQLQLDIYGEAADALAQTSDIGSIAGWRVFADLLDWLVDHWDRPDEGIWETRGGRQDFTYSRLMTWVAFDRGIRLATAHARPADLPRWTRARDAVFAQIIDRGWSRKRRAFVQHFRTEVLDASLLLMPRMGFITPRDPDWLSTLDAMDAELVSDSLVYRYDPAASPDGLRGAEGTFTLCSFLYVEALARAGRVQQARYAFDKMLTYANHVGLFAEEIGPSGEQLGNFPQAFTHLALVAAAMALDDELDRVESGSGTS